jgi:hypothetical protein
MKTIELKNTFVYLTFIYFDLVLLYLLDYYATFCMENSFKKRGIKDLFSYHSIEGGLHVSKQCLLL